MFVKNGKRPTLCDKKVQIQIEITRYGSKCFKYGVISIRAFINLMFPLFVLIKDTSFFSTSFSSTTSAETLKSIMMQNWGQV